MRYIPLINGHRRKICQNQPKPMILRKKQGEIQEEDWDYHLRLRIENTQSLVHQYR